MDDADLDEITLQSARYHAIVNKEIQGVADRLEVEQELNSLRANILKILKAKREYLKYKKLTFGSQEATASVAPDTISVFFSVGSPHNDEQQSYVNKLTETFKAQGILLSTLAGWNDNDPLVPIIEALKNSSGCLVLALERYYVEEGIGKRGSDQEAKISNQAYTSPWLHIETALARSLDLPLMILKDTALINEGLIHNDKQEWGIVRISQSSTAEIDEYPVKHFILNWIKQVKSYHREKQGG